MERILISKLKHHPDNPRIGDIDAIAESLETHGQYRPVVANRQTNHIIAGNHTVKAARRLGWKNINVQWVDVDNKTELAIMLADNRLSDLATYDENLLIDLLTKMPDLTGTGWTQDAIDELIKDTENTEYDGGKEPTAGILETDTPINFRLGKHQGEIRRADYEQWTRNELDVPNKKDAIAIIRLRLEIPDQTDTPHTPPEKLSNNQTRTTPIDQLTPHPLNPREGDIGALTESLKTFGQYRTIVATTDGIILAGHHIVQAAKTLGWTHVDVTYIDCDEIQATKILLVDNRTSDLGTYDNDLLRQAVLQAVNNPATGWQPDDIQNLMEGKPHRLKNPTGKTRCNIGDYRWNEPASIINGWSATVDTNTIAQRLGLPETALTEKDT